MTTFTFLSTDAYIRGSKGELGEDMMFPEKFSASIRVVTSLVWLVLSVPGIVLAGDRDVFVSAVVLYTKLPPDSTEAREHGRYPRITQWDIHGGLSPDKIDVVGVVNGKELEVTIVLEIFPIVGVTNWTQTEGTTDTQLLETSKTLFSSAMRLEKLIKLKGRTEVKFPDIDLGRLIKSWRDRGYWPTEFVFRLTADPVSGETALSDNVMEFKLPVKPPD